MSNSPDPRDALRALVRTDLSSFIQRAVNTVDPGSLYLHSWHIDAIAYQLERIESGEINRLIITMPPRSLKSISASVAFPSWLLGRDPSLRILAVSYAEGLSDKLALDCMKVMEAGWYKDAFPQTRIAKGRGARSDFETTQGGGRFSTSVGGTLTGRGGDIILLDDPHKPEDAASEVKRKSVLDWYGSTLLSRLNNPKTGPIVLIQDFRGERKFIVKGVIPKDDKATRLLSVSHLIEGGNIAVPSAATWLAPFQREVTLFPNGKNDDQVDSLSQFLKWFAEPQYGAWTTEPLYI